MTLQKAMRVRSELKMAAAHLKSLLDTVSFNIDYEGDNAPSEQTLAAKRAEKIAGLDNMTYEEVVKKLFRITDACKALNNAIENVNADGHHLLFEETAVKSKISYLDYLLNKQRAIKPKTTITKTDYNEADNKGNYKKIETNCYSYPILDDSCFGMSIVEYRRKLNGELADIRDRISTFNATQKVDYELPDGLL